MGSSCIDQLFNPPRDIPHPCVHMQACPPHFLRSSAWNQKVRETPCSDVARRYDGALTAGHPCHGGKSAFQREPPCTASSRHSFLRPSPSWCFFHKPRGLSTSLGAGQHTLRLLARHTRLSTFPEPSCWLSCTEDGLVGSRMCHRGFGSGPCP